jgi:GT2 family glycosyltransferase
MNGISVVIPTLNRTDFLIDTLKDLVKQKCDFPFEILVVDQSKVEDKVVVEFAKEYNTIKYHYITTFRGLPEARNYRASVAKYDFLLYLDDDISCKSNLLHEHYKALAQKNIGVVAGGITEKNKKNVDSSIGDFIFWSATPLRGFHNNQNKEVLHAGGGNFSVKKNIFEQVLGVDENLTKGAALYEETDFCFRVKEIGCKVYFNYEAHVFHLAADTGGCRVPNIVKYIKSLSRNRSIIIGRYLPWYFKISAHLYLLRLVISYMITYRKIEVIISYFNGVIEGQKVAKQKPLNSFI